MQVVFFFFNDTATTEIYTLSLHDALPIYVLAAPIQEAPDAVEELGFDSRSRGVPGGLGSGPPARGKGDGLRSRLRARELFRQRALPAQEHGPGGRLQGGVVLGREELLAQDEHAALILEPLGPG